MLGGGGRGTLGTNDLGLQSKGTKWRGKGAVGRRGTMAPLARRKRVRPVRRSGLMHTPSSALGSALAVVWLALVLMLGNHAAGAEGEWVAGGSVTVKKIVRCRGGAGCVCEGVARSSNSFVEVESVLEREVIREAGNGGICKLSEGKDGAFYTRSVFAGRGKLKGESEGSEGGGE